MLAWHADAAARRNRATTDASSQLSRRTDSGTHHGASFSSTVERPTGNARRAKFRRRNVGPGFQSASTAQEIAGRSKKDAVTSDVVDNAVTNGGIIGNSPLP